jgi:membrane-associated protease RseP (regulator of RpoE activity)
MWRMTTASIGALGHFPSAVLHTATQLFSDVPRDPNGPVSVIGIGKISGEIAAADMSLRDKVASNLDLLGSVNLFLFLFNLVPLLPLDGGHVLGAMYEGIRRTVSRVRGKGATGPADTARMLPFAYVMTVLMIGMSVIVMAADILKPMSLG